MEKICSRCKQSKPLTSFRAEKAKKDGKGSWCAECNNESECLCLIQIRHEMYKQYGGEFCANCGETLFEALTLDHINGCPKEERCCSTMRAFRKLKAQGWPLGFQVLCYNCNFLKFAHPDLLAAYAQSKRIKNV